MSQGKVGVGVFPTPSGQPQHRSQTLDYVLRPTLERAKLDTRFHMHSLRHSFCSALIAQGTPPTEVRKYSGHSPLSTLLDTYSHFIPSEQTGCIDRFAAGCSAEIFCVGHFLDTPPTVSSEEDVGVTPKYLKKRRGGDSNPRASLGGYTISSRAVSTGLTHLSPRRGVL